MDPGTEIPSPVRSLYFIRSSGRVVVALHSGRIFLCQSGNQSFIPQSSPEFRIINIFVYFLANLERGTRLFLFMKVTFERKKKIIWKIIGPIFRVLLPIQCSIRYVGTLLSCQLRSESKMPAWHWQSSLKLYHFHKNLGRSMWIRSIFGWIRIQQIRSLKTGSGSGSYWH